MIRRFIKFGFGVAAFLGLFMMVNALTLGLVILVVLLILYFLIKRISKRRNS